tara:strand:- start:103 stop:966 length:864 start_codon:yes stop_codon:yes gene_type:complete
MASPLEKIETRIASSLTRSNWQFNAEGSNRLLVVEFQSDFRLQEIDLAVQDIADSQWSDYCRLFDFSRVPFAPTTTELLEVGKHMANWQAAEEVKIAWLAASQKDMGLLRIIVDRSWDQLMRVFLSESEARRWLLGSAHEFVDSPLRIEHKHIRLRGTIDLDAVLRQQQVYREQPDYSPEMPILWDLREAALTESLEEVQTLAVYIAGNHNRDRAGFRSAVLIDSHIMDLLIREMTRVSGWPASDIAVFRSYREAIGWLAIDVADTDQSDISPTSDEDNQDKESFDD